MCIANMPISRPGELTETGNDARLRHACQAKIEPVSEQACQKNPFVSGRLASPQMGEAIGEKRPLRNLRQQVGDADARQQSVKTCSQRFSFRRGRFLNGGNLQYAPLERDVWQQPIFRFEVNRGQPFIEEGTTIGDELLKISIHGDRQCGAACKSRPPEGVIGVQKSASS
jgi:hypothetical protein